MAALIRVLPARCDSHNPNNSPGAWGRMSPSSGEIRPRSRTRQRVENKSPIPPVPTKPPGENPLPPPPDLSAPPQGQMYKSPEKCGHFSDDNLSTLTPSPTSELVYVATVTERGVKGQERFARVGGQRCGATAGGAGRGGAMDLHVRSPSDQVARLDVETGKARWTSSLVV